MEPGDAFREKPGGGLTVTKTQAVVDWAPETPVIQSG
jgi:hypothetical protein